MQPKVYLVQDHDIDSALIDSDALQVLRRLKDAGFQAYLVGGSVRDLLVKRLPKDYDISTSARPEQIKSIFQRQCILIGRRFRLAHIRFGHKIFEVSTFRRGESADDLIIQDNEWGSPQEDVLRRDFTINGLFYDPVTHSIIDYVGGWEDIKAGILRVIGEPTVRFKQDPVRLIRLLKFKARFNFQIEAQTENAACECIHEIVKSSPARILEEFFRMLESGSASPFLQLLGEYGLLKILLPQLILFLKTPKGKTVFHYLACADKMHQHNITSVLERPVLIACLLFPILEKELEKQYLSKNKTPHIGEITMVGSTLIKNILTGSFSHFPRRISAIALSIMVAQYRLTPLSGKRHYREKLFKYKEFTMSLKFLKLRAMVDERLVEIYTSIRNQYREFMRHSTKKPHPSPAERHNSHQNERVHVGS